MLAPTSLHVLRVVSSRRRRTMGLQVEVQNSRITRSKQRDNSVGYSPRNFASRLGIAGTICDCKSVLDKPRTSFCRQGGNAACPEDSGA